MRTVGKAVGVMVLLWALWVPPYMLLSGAGGPAMLVAAVVWFAALGTLSKVRF